LYPPHAPPLPNKQTQTFLHIIGKKPLPSL